MAMAKMVNHWTRLPHLSLSRTSVGSTHKEGGTYACKFLEREGTWQTQLNVQRRLGKGKSIEWSISTEKRVFINVERTSGIMRTFVLRAYQVLLNGGPLGRTLICSVYPAPAAHKQYVKVTFWVNNENPGFTIIIRSILMKI